MRPLAVSAVACVAMAAGFALGSLRPEPGRTPAPQAPAAHSPDAIGVAPVGPAPSARYDSALLAADLAAIDQEIRRHFEVEDEQARRVAEIRGRIRALQEGSDPGGPPAGRPPAPTGLPAAPDWGDPRLWPTPRTPETLARAAKLVADGQAALAVGRLDEAEAAFRDALDLDRFNADAIAGLVKILAKRQPPETR